MIPQGKQDTRFMHTSLDISARTYSYYQAVAIVAITFEAYEGMHRERSKGVLSLANVMKNAWRVGKPSLPNEELALSAIVGMNYIRPELPSIYTTLLKLTQDKLGIELGIETAVKRDIFCKTALDALKLEEDTSWITSQAESDMEFVSTPEEN